MAGSLLILLDDIALVLDDVAAMTKIAAKKTVGVLGDDLALNANQVTGVEANRELPVVWAVAKGSLVNKMILVPTALLISAFLPVLITPLLMMGGLYLCFEGAEKIVHSALPQLFVHEAAAHPPRTIDINKNTDLAAFEKEKIRGAIRTDFILSAEIVVVSLGTMAAATLLNKAVALSLIAIIMTVGVYGLVAVIVKMDDVGAHWLKKGGALAKIGQGVLLFAPKLMKFLSFAGTVAMFLVGGGILAHGLPMLHHASDQLNLNWGIFAGLGQSALGGLVGLVAGLVAVGLVLLVGKLRKII